MRVTAKQFGWEFLYTGPDGKFDTADDKMLEGDLHVPVDKVVRVYLRGKDVIHSFFIPVMRLKQDAVPGREIIAWFEADQDWEVRDALRRIMWPRPFGDEGMVDGPCAEDV